jgi:ABC-type hemin transport system ATPase subunit
MVIHDLAAAARYCDQLLALADGRQQASARRGR